MIHVHKLIVVLKSRVAGVAGWSTTAVAVSAVTGILTARGLGVEQRGSLALATSIAGLCVLVAALGTNVSARRHLPRRNGVTLRGYERLSLALLAPLLIILFAALYIVVSVVDPTFGDWRVGLAFIGYGVGYFFSNQSLEALNALGLVVHAARTNAIGSMLCLLLVAGASLLGGGLAAMIWAYAISAVFQFGVAIVLVARRRLRTNAEATGMARLVKDGVALLGLNLGQTLTFRSDTIILGALSSPHQLGLYAVAITPASILRIPSNALGQVALHQAALGGEVRRRILLRTSALLALLIVPAVAGGLAAEWLFITVYGVEYRAAAEVFRVLLLAELLLAPFLVLGRANAGLGRTWAASFAGVAGVGTLVTSAIVLIPIMGAMGAAWASVFAYGVMSTVATVVFLGSFRSSEDSRAGAEVA